MEDILKEDYLDDGRKKINQNFKETRDSFATVNQTIIDNADNVPTLIKEASNSFDTKLTAVDEKATSAVSSASTAVSTSNNASERAQDTADQFAGLKQDVQNLVAETGNEVVEIVDARRDTKGIMQPNLATRLQKDFDLMLTEQYLNDNSVIRYRGELTGSVNFDILDNGFYSVEDFEASSSIGYPPTNDKSGLLEVFTKKDCTKLQRFKPIVGSEVVRVDKKDIALGTWQTIEETLSIEQTLFYGVKELADVYDESLVSGDDE